jgi:hypothetical protein
MNTYGDIWKHGSLIELVGTVRSKNGDLSISCSSAKLYDYETNISDQHSEDKPILASQKPKGTMINKPQLTTPDTRANNTLNGENGNKKSGKLIISLKETSNHAEDQDLLKSIASLCAEFRGDSKIEFHIITSRKTVIMEWPVLKVDMSDLFKGKIETLLGQSGSITTI